MFFKSLVKMVGSSAVLITDEDKAYARMDQSTNVAESLPRYVVRVATISQLVDVVRLCLKEGVPIVMRGAGSGKSGGAVGDKDSVIIDCLLLNRIIDIDTDNLIAEVEPGVVLLDLQEAVRAYGLYYPPDPQSASFCTIGGNVAENAAGPSTLKYGSTRDYVLGGQAIIGTGEVIDFGKRAIKGVAGYDIAALLCGSEGTLAIFTKFILRLLPYPKSHASALFYFSDENRALLAVNAILRSGHLPTTLEYIDENCLKALTKFTAMDYAKNMKAALMVECDASFVGGASQQMEDIASILPPYSLIKTIMADSAELRQNLWQWRSKLSEACTNFLGKKLSEDVAVPLGKIFELGSRIKQWSRPPHLLCGSFGHAGDGNLHVQIMFDDDVLKNEAIEIRHQIILFVLELDGTITAEHGVGLQKKAYLPLEQGPSLIALQKRIKETFDPHNLLNPGKIFDL